MKKLVIAGIGLVIVFIVIVLASLASSWSHRGAEYPILTRFAIPIYALVAYIVMRLLTTRNKSMAQLVIAELIVLIVLSASAVVSYQDTYASYGGSLPPGLSLSMSAIAIDVLSTCIFVGLLMMASRIIGKPAESEV